MLWIFSSSPDKKICVLYTQRGLMRDTRKLTHMKHVYVVIHNKGLSEVDCI